MLQDPDSQYEEWQDTVWASSLDMARSKCERLADELDLTEVSDVTQVTRVKSRRGDYKYICWFRTEVQP